MPRRPGQEKWSERVTRLHAYVPKEMAEEVAREATRRRVSISEVIRDAWQRAREAKR